ncbi:MAG: hypothetical protein AABY53_02855 [Bdellovibrionota bacterium]|mgnify:CR=1 FL=1
MNRNLSVVALIGIVGLPLMLFFQNCGKQDFAPTGLEQSSSKSSQLGDDVPVSMQDGSTQVEDDDTDKDVADAKRECEIADAIDQCENIELNKCKMKCDDGEDPLECAASIARERAEAKLKCQSNLESNNARVISDDYKSVVGLRGKHVLTKRDFNGNTVVDLINNSYGKLTLCGLTVKSLSRSGGRLILMNDSKIEKIVSFYGQVVAVDKSGATVKVPLIPDANK